MPSEQRTARTAFADQLLGVDHGARADDHACCLFETARNLVWVGVPHRLAGIKTSEGQRGSEARLARGLCPRPPVDSDAFPLLVNTETSVLGALVMPQSPFRWPPPPALGCWSTTSAGRAIRSRPYPAGDDRVGGDVGHDLNLYTIAYFDHGAQGLFDWRGLVLVIAAPLFAIGGSGEGDR